MCICIFLSMIVTKYCLFFNNCSFARHLLFVVLVVYNRSCELFCLLIGFVCALFVNFLFCQTICINSIHSLFFRIYFFFYFLPSSSLFLLFFFLFILYINLLHKIHVTRRATQTDDQNVRNRFACCFVENIK